MWIDLTFWFMAITGLSSIFIHTHYENPIGTGVWIIFFFATLPPLSILEPLEYRIWWLRPLVFVVSWLIVVGLAIYTLVF